ncbi:MAG TPA: hypothetical protein VKJ45_04415 [Blastocatellia bacterium]|nr:hypothetical protein [Blastocatellia bacterium]
MTSRAFSGKLVAGIAITIWSALGCRPAYGWLRPWYEDITVVQRSELLVVGRLERGSIVSASPGQGFSQYHARLAITKVLKGSLEEAEIPVIIYHGLTPLVAGYINDGGIRIDWRAHYAGSPKDAIQIVDTGNSAISFESLVEDAGEDNLWFLRRRSGGYGREAGNGDFGIVDPEDLQPLSLRDYFQAYLSADPEAGVKAQLALHPELGRRAQRYLDHLKVQRILAVADKETRIQRLLPFYIKGQAWVADPRTQPFEARRGIVSCGEMSAPYLQQVFDDPKLVRLKKDIIDMWGEIGFQGPVYINQLVELLEEHDRFWAGQHLEQDWWNRDYNSKLTVKRRRIYDEVRASVILLGKIGDETAANAVNQTRATWDRLNNPLSAEIIKQCDEALRRIESRSIDGDMLGR